MISDLAIVPVLTSVENTSSGIETSLAPHIYYEVQRNLIIDNDWNNIDAVLALELHGTG
jgi:hypothetical protein